MDRHLETMRDELGRGEAQLFDVREQLEWQEGHLKSASLVPLSHLQKGIEPDGRQKGVKTYLHCRSGNRVYAAAPLLEAMGYSEVVPLDEGFEELVEQGFETD